MLFVIYNPEKNLSEEIVEVFANVFKRRLYLRFSDYAHIERKKPENRESFIVGDGTITTKLLTMLYERLTMDEKLLDEKRIVLFDEDVIAKIDYAVSIKPYFEDLLSLDVDIVYLAKYESTVDRLREAGLNFEIYKTN